MNKAINENIFLKLLFIFSIIIFCIGLNCINCVPDNDLWARLTAGEYICENLAILKHDIFSYTPTHIWYDHEWGSSVVFYLIFKYFGVDGLILLKGILTGLTFFVCFKTVELRKPKFSVSYNILYFAAMFLALNKSLGSVVRCLLFTCLFFSLFLYILEKSRTGNNKILIILPIIMLLWANMHGGCISGLGLIVLYCIGEFLNKKDIKKYVITLFLCLIVLFINPYGIEYVKFLFLAASMERDLITEWTSPFNQFYLKDYIKYKLYLVFIILTQIAYFIKTKMKYANLDKTKFIIIITTIYLSVTHIRHIPFFVFSAGTLLYDEFYYLFNTSINYIKDKLKIKKDFKNLIVLKEVAVYFFVLILSFPNVIAKKEISINSTAYPRFAVEFIDINNLHGNLFINFDWGSYAAYKLFPKNLIVMDGRYEEVYNPNLLNELKNFHLVKNDWYKIIRDYKTDVMVIEKKYPVYNKIKNHEDWKLVFENNLSGVFVPKDKVKEQYLMPIPNDEYYNKTLFNKNFNLKINPDIK